MAKEHFLRVISLFTYYLITTLMSDCINYKIIKYKEVKIPSSIVNVPLSLFQCTKTLFINSKGL